jgi:uncharacterized protein with FMN-binding domain
MKKSFQIALFLIAGLLAGVHADTNITAKAESGPWVDGAYPGVAGGHNGPVQVAVVIRKGRIDRVEVVRHKEKSQKAIDTVVRHIVAQQSVDVDAVSGATYTSGAVLRAVKNALEQAH